MFTLPTEIEERTCECSFCGDHFDQDAEGALDFAIGLHSFCSECVARFSEGDDPWPHCGCSRNVDGDDWCHFHSVQHELRQYGTRENGERL